MVLGRAVTCRLFGSWLNDVSKIGLLLAADGGSWVAVGLCVLGLIMVFFG